MKSLCIDGSDEAVQLQRLTKLVAAQTLTGTQAWSLFSSPEKSKFEIAGVPYKVEKANHKSLRALKVAVCEHLYKRFGGACAYCRRPVAHYGYGWQIEHVLSKQWHPTKAFELANLAVGCIECNSWKGSQVDRKVRGVLPLPIVNPVAQGFSYSKHLHFVSVATERLCVAKYKHLTPEGEETYKRLRFREIERAIVVDSVDGAAASLHARIDQLIARALAEPEANELVTLLTALKSNIYADPKKS